MKLNFIVICITFLLTIDYLHSMQKYRSEESNLNSADLDRNYKSEILKRYASDSALAQAEAARQLKTQKSGSDTSIDAIGLLFAIKRSQHASQEIPPEIRGSIERLDDTGCITFTRRLLTESVVEEA
jgi:hypothetical protein